MSSFKNQALARDLRARLSAMVAGLTITETVDSFFNPILFLSAGGETMYITITVEPDPSGGVDGLNLTQTRYSPAQITILRATAVGNEILRTLAVSESARSGCKVLVYEIASVPPSFSLTGATEVAVIPSNAWSPLTLSE